MSSIMGRGFDRRLITVPGGVLAVGLPLIGMIFGEGDIQKDSAAILAIEAVVGVPYGLWSITEDEK